MTNSDLFCTGCKSGSVVQMKRPPRLDVRVLEAARNAQVNGLHKHRCKRKLVLPSMPYDLHKRAVRHSLFQAYDYLDNFFDKADTPFDQIPSDVILILLHFLDDAIGDLQRLAELGSFPCDRCIQWLKDLAASVMTRSESLHTWRYHANMVPVIS